jgi:hypothetical protein
VAISPDVVSFVRRRFDCCDLLQRSVIRNVAPKASSVTLTTNAVSHFMSRPSVGCDSLTCRTKIWRSEGQPQGQ